jgi:murein DD-endopeptidase MepM/ murein hydrolase activator NlpD
VKKHLVFYAVLISFTLVSGLVTWSNILGAEEAMMQLKGREEAFLSLKEENKYLSEENTRLSGDLERAFERIELTAAVSPLIGLVSEDEIFHIIDEIPKGYIFRDGFALTAGFGISIGAHGKPRTNHTGSDIIPIDPSNLESWEVTPIADGVVEAIGIDAIFGKYIYIRHSERVRTFAGHLEKIFYNATVGKQVKANDTVAIMGNSGLVYSDLKKGGGAHVHYEIQIWIDNVDGSGRWVAVDSLPFLDS